MSIFDALTMLGGLCLFLFGMNIMGESLERRAGNRLKNILGKLTKNKYTAFLTGLAVTAIIQSSSATTVMVVGFVNSGLMTLSQSIGIIMGANIGTTVTAWILSLSGISGDNIALQLVKPTSFTPILALIGIVCYLTAKSEKKKDTGLILLGFATLMFGMDTMSDAVSGLADVPAFRNLFILFKNSIFGVLAGAVLTAIIQSSSASVGILQALTVTGQVSYGAAVPIIMGQNIGTCVTALLSSFGANKNAKRAAAVHLLFNFIGTAVWLSVFTAVSVLFKPEILDKPASYLGIATTHTVFNILCTLLLLPFSFVLEKLALKFVPDSESSDTNELLDERLLMSPTIALERCSALVCDMMDFAKHSFDLSVDSLIQNHNKNQRRIYNYEEKTDQYEDMIASYLIKLSRHPIGKHESARISKLLKAIGDCERIADHSINIYSAFNELNEKRIAFTGTARKELEIMCRAVTEIVELAKITFVNNDLDSAVKVEPLEQVIDDLKSQLRNQHILRLKQGSCTVEAGFIWADLINDLERVSDHCSNIAACVLDAADDNMNIHQTTKQLKANISSNEFYILYREKYMLKI